MSEVVNINSKKEPETIETVKPLVLPRIDKEGQFWTLEFNAASVSLASDMKFNAALLLDSKAPDFSKMSILIYCAFQRHHKREVTTVERAISIWKNYRFEPVDGTGDDTGYLFNKGIVRLLGLYSQELGIIPNADAVEVTLD